MSQETSEFWKTLWDDPDTKRVYSYEINGVLYGDDEIISDQANQSLFEELSIGNATCAELKLKIAPKNEKIEIPRSAQINRYVQLENGSRKSERLSKGIFYISQRPYDGYSWEFPCFDAMRKADNYWEPSDDFTFPMPMREAVDVICSTMGITQDPRNELNDSYMIDYPDSNTTMRDVLCWIAAAHGGNFHISDKGELRLVKLSTIKNYLSLLVNEQENTISFGEGKTRILLEDPFSDDADDRKDKHFVGQDITSGEDNGIWEPISRVTLQVNDDESYTSGTDDGLEIVGFCPYATEEMCEEILFGIKGFRYQMFEASAANIDLAYELGDGISVDGIISFIAKADDNGTGYIDVSAPGQEETVEEYPAITTTPQQRETNRKIAQTRSAIEKSNKEIKLYVDNEAESIRSEMLISDEEIKQSIADTEEGLSSEIDQKIDSISLTVGATQSDGTKSYADITLTVDGEEKKGRVNILGDTSIDGNLVANALYAVSSYFTDLTSSKLNTNDEIQRFLRHDKSDYSYTKITDNGIDVYARFLFDDSGYFAHDDDFNQLYWERSIENATIKNGWPYDANGNRIYMTTKETEYPVMVYEYITTPIVSISKDVDVSHGSSGYEYRSYRPKITFKRSGVIGVAGSIYVDELGNFIIEGNNLILNGLPTTQSLDLSEWDNGIFSETMSDGTENVYSVQFDSQGRPEEIQLQNDTFGVSTYSIMSTSSEENTSEEKIRNKLKIKW